MQRVDAAWRQQHFSMQKDVMAAMFNVWRQTENPNRLIDAYLRTILSNFIWNDGALGFFEERRPNKNKVQQGEYWYESSSWSKNWLTTQVTWESNL